MACNMSSGRQTGEINPLEVNRALAHTRLGGSVLHFPEIDSTQTLALEAARAGQAAGAWVADAQTAGRGRGGHTWHSAPGDGLYVSALFTPRLPASTSSLSLVAGLAAWDAIREVAGLTVDIRWPNDLVTRPGVHPRARKLGGILVESVVAPAEREDQPARLRYAVIGIGLNIGHAAFPPELAELATSLRLEGWHRPQRQPLLIALLVTLDLYVRELEAQYEMQDGYADTHGSPKRMPSLAEASTWITGKRVHVPEDGGYTGVTAGLDGDGFLLVREDPRDNLSPRGTLRTVRSGGVREA